jgi:hypothetical protein
VLCGRTLNNQILNGFMDITLKISFIAAITFTGILCGASFDQSFKQLPARHRIGMITFSAYAKAADLKNGVLWYAIIGIGSALLTIITAIITLKNNLPENFRVPIYGAAFFAICHSVCTSQAAPTYFKQKSTTDEKALAKIFRKFEIIQTIRSIFIALNFASLLCALSVLI